MTFGGLNGVIISAESQTATNAKIYREQSEANRKMKATHESVFYLFFTARLSAYLQSVSPLPAFYCLLKTAAANFAQTTLQ